MDINSIFCEVINLKEKIFSKVMLIIYIVKILLNSLYGRFGMNDNFAEIHIIQKDYINDFENKFLDLIINKTVLDDYILIETKPLEIIENDESSHNVSIGVAAAI